MTTTTDDLGRDTLGVPILPSDRVRIMSWGGTVRLTDVGAAGTIVRRKRTGSLLLDLSEGRVAEGQQVTALPSQVAVCRRDGLTGHEGNRGTRRDSHKDAR